MHFAWTLERVALHENKTHCLGIFVATLNLLLIRLAFWDAPSSLNNLIFVKNDKHFAFSNLFIVEKHFRNTWCLLTLVAASFLCSSLVTVLQCTKISPPKLYLDTHFSSHYSLPLLTPDSNCFSENRKFKATFGWQFFHGKRYSTWKQSSATI